MKKLITKQFIQRAIKFHGDKYNYDLVDYIKNNTKVDIICNKCGDTFKQIPSSHLSGHGCHKCDIKKNSYTKFDFINKAKFVHSDKYDYSLVDYVNSRTKVKIVCNIDNHGVFEQTPGHHLNGSGCRKCRNKNAEGGYQLSRAILGFYKGSGYLYVIKMFNDYELFGKIGVSKNLDGRKRTLKCNSKYNVKIIESIFFKDFNQAIIEEDRLHKLYKNYKYIPKNKFGGRYECFTEEILKFDY